MAGLLKYAYNSKFLMVQQHVPGFCNIAHVECHFAAIMVLFWVKIIEHLSYCCGWEILLCQHDDQNLLFTQKLAQLPVGVVLVMVCVAFLMNSFVNSFVADGLMDADEVSLVLEWCPNFGSINTMLSFVTQLLCPLHGRMKCWCLPIFTQNFSGFFLHIGPTCRLGENLHD